MGLTGDKINMEIKFETKSKSLRVEISKLPLKPIERHIPSRG